MIVDLPLVARIEGSAAADMAMSIDALVATHPDCGASMTEVDGGVAAAMGAGRYVNRAIGVGLGGTPASDVLDALEAFYGQAQLPTSLEVSPWVPTSLVVELRSRGYALDWFRNVYAHSLDSLPPRAGAAIQEVDASLENAWTEVLGGASQPGTAARENSDWFCAAMHRVPTATDLVALVDGAPAATGTITVVDDIAWFGGAATLEAARGQGLQTALLAERLHRAREMGCTLAAVTALPNGSSARNILRAGFQLLYTQAVMTRV